MKTIAFVQARMSSNRFPGKVLADLCGEPMIISMLSRVKKAKSLDNIVLVTSVEESDDCLASSVRDHGFPVFRGPLKNVLERFVQAAEVYPAEQYVRLTGDCPQVDPKIIDQVVTLLNDEIADYASNVEPPTYPNGMDCEAFTAQALQSTYITASSNAEREHVTLLMRSENSKFKRANLYNTVDQSNIRLTVDYPEDLEQIRTIVRAIGNNADTADLKSIINFLAAGSSLVKPFDKALAVST